MGEISMKYAQTNQSYSAVSAIEKTKQKEAVFKNPQGYEESKKEFSKIVKQKRQDVYDSLEKGEEETSFPIGASSMTQSEWKNLIRKVDKTIVEIKKEQEIKKQQDLKKIRQKSEKEKRVRQEERLKEEKESAEEKKEIIDEIIEERVLKLLKERENN